MIRDGQIDDAKLKHRLAQIEEEGNDPAKTKRTYGDDGGSGDDDGSDDDERKLGFKFDEDDEELEEPEESEEDEDDENSLEQLSKDVKPTK